MWGLIAIAVLLVLWLWKSRYARPKLLQMPPETLEGKRITTSKKLKVFVTGGSGNLGAQLIEILVSDEYKERVGKIIVFDMVKGKEKDPRVEYVIGNICSYSQVVEQMRGVDIVYHMASMIDLRSAER
jgi:FlaA1/EpsC-like NDP-sugar epimerase